MARPGRRVRARQRKMEKLCLTYLALSHYNVVSRFEVKVRGCGLCRWSYIKDNWNMLLSIVWVRYKCKSTVGRRVLIRSYYVQNGVVR